MEQKNTPVIVPILNTVTTIFFTLAFSFALLAFMNGQDSAVRSTVIYGFCAVLNLVTSVKNWIRYRKEKDFAQDETKHETAE